MRKMMLSLLVAATVLVSGVTVTTFSAGQLTGTAWAEGGAD